MTIPNIATFDHGTGGKGFFFFFKCQYSWIENGGVTSNKLGRAYLLIPGTLKPTSFKWMEMVISNHFLCKDLVHPIETTIYKWMFQVPGIPYLGKIYHFIR